MASPHERHASGKSLRASVPREAHAGWKAPDNRRDPIELLLESNHGRIPGLIPIRFGRMMHSPFTFYRGAAAIMAADLSAPPQSGLRVQACGDAHLLNFGGFATPERKIVFDINDFDETLPAPWEWDLKRLTASIVIAARDLKFGAADAAHAAKATARSYTDRMAEYSSKRTLEIWYETVAADDVAAVIGKRVEKRVKSEKERSAAAYMFPKLVEREGATPCFKDDPPLIFHPTEALAPGMTSGFREPMAVYRASLPDHIRLLFDRYRLCDVVVKVVGIGSVGTMCCVGLWLAADDDPLFLQIKEAGASVLEPYAGTSVYTNHGQRVVAGQHLMQSASDIFLGWTKGENGRDVYLRQLRDMKLSAVIDDWDIARLREYGRLCAWALAKAHARSGDPEQIAGYIGSSSRFADAVTAFAVEYADQNERDHLAFRKAVKDGRIETVAEG